MKDCGSVPVHPGPSLLPPCRGGVLVFVECRGGEGLGLHYGPLDLKRTTVEISDIVSVC